MKRLAEIIRVNEDWLMLRALEYAKERGYTAYTSTLAEAWRISIAGLSDALIKAIKKHSGGLPELSPHENYKKDPVAAFGVLEARRHRERGVEVGMFLGLLKYYRSAYTDLIEKDAKDDGEKQCYSEFVIRCFDRIELGFCTEWLQDSRSEHVRELQTTNRWLTNEKNKYLTIFESLFNPVFLLDSESMLDQMNYAALDFLGEKGAPGASYYGRKGYSDLQESENAEASMVPAGDRLNIHIVDILPWLKEDLERFAAADDLNIQFERKWEAAGGTKYVLVSCTRMLDVSGKFVGTVLILNDLTEQRAAQEETKRFAVKLTKINEELERLSNLDGLTGILNRRIFNEVFSREWRRVERESTPISLLMVDIDHFKNYNDTYGHLQGDNCLKLVSRAIQEQLKRPGDYVARYGGEEFVVLLPNTDSGGALLLAEAMRAKVEELCLEHASSPVSRRVTVSIGVSSVVPDSRLDCSALLEAADKALYEAKRQGRNRVAVKHEVIS